MTSACFWWLIFCFSSSSSSPLHQTEIFVIIWRANILLKRNLDSTRERKRFPEHVRRLKPIMLLYVYCWTCYWLIARHLKVPFFFLLYFDPVGTVSNSRNCAAAFIPDVSPVMISHFHSSRVHDKKSIFFVDRSGIFVSRYPIHQPFVHGIGDCFLIDKHAAIKSCKYQIHFHSKTISDSATGVLPLCNAGFS